jgi:hypothetical protein
MDFGEASGEGEAPVAGGTAQRRFQAPEAGAGRRRNQPVMSADATAS